MVRRWMIPAALALTLVAPGGCGSITDPRLVTSFNWTEADDPETVTEGISTSVALGELFILGQVVTPARCYELTGDFASAGANLSLRVTARSNGSPNCDQRIGGFRYTASWSNLNYGTYNLTVVHDVDGATRGEYTETLIIR